MTGTVMGVQSRLNSNMNIAYDTYRVKENELCNSHNYSYPFSSHIATGVAFIAKTNFHA